ncbi:MFS transporter [Kribbella monticola]|uniref:MFS transporter n=1 Tax=Kribbella monticola TaxID=2185285 RepID=UPI000DD2DF28|nr:MFS transporter [Kribbella monticola]
MTRLGARSGGRRTRDAAGNGYRAVFAVREYRAIFAAHVLSVLGGVFAEVALAVLVFRETGSALLTALIFALGFLPYSLSGVLLSGLADRHPPRRLLVTCDLLSAGCMATMAVPRAPLAALFVLRCIAASISPLFTGTRAASLVDILPDDLYILGRSLVRIVSQSAQIVGYGLGGLALVWLPPRAALCVAVATFLSSALLLRLGTRERPARTPAAAAANTTTKTTKTKAKTRAKTKAKTRAKTKAETKAKYQSLTSTGQLLRDPRIRALLLLWWIPPMFFVVAEGAAAPYTTGLGADSAGFGAFLAAMPAGNVISEILAGTLLTPATRDRIVFPLAALSLLPMIAFVTHPALPLAIALMFTTGLCAAYTLGMDRWFVQAVPEQQRGQAMSLLGAGIMTLQGFGMATGGAVAEITPAYTVICGAGAIGTLSVLGVLRSVRRSPEPTHARPEERR